MKRITKVLMGAGALALAACSGGGEGGNNVTADTADENASANEMFEEANSLANATGAAPARANEAESNSAAAATPAAPVDRAPAARRPTAAPKAAPAPSREQPKETAPRPAPPPEPAPAPKTDCTPEHRAAGHC